jgi:DNA-binding HxlR family transcriptional regulator
MATPPTSWRKTPRRERLRSRWQPSVLQNASDWNTVLAAPQHFLHGQQVRSNKRLQQWNDRMKFERSACPITNVLDVLGDKWTLLVIRDLVLGKRRYQEFMSSPERMASNILADRLKRLEAGGLVTRRTYQGNPARYEYLLTKKGKGLEPILEAIIVWGQKHYPGTKRFPRIDHR